MVAFGPAAVFAAEHLRLGRLVRVLGRLRTRTYQVDGQMHYRTEVVVDTVSPLDAPVAAPADAAQAEDH